MKSRTAITVGVLAIVVCAFSPLVFASGEQLKVTLADRYTGGETVLIKIGYSDASGSPLILEKPARLKIDITKPDGSVVSSEARRGTWNAPGEYFDVYTIDYMGPYSVKVSDPETGATAAAGFTSVFITGGSLFVLVFGVALLVAAFVYWGIASRKKTARA